MIIKSSTINTTTKFSILITSFSIQLSNIIKNISPINKSNFNRSMKINIKIIHATSFIQHLPCIPVVSPWNLYTNPAHCPYFLCLYPICEQHPSRVYPEFNRDWGLDSTEILRRLYGDAWENMTYCLSSGNEIKPIERL